MIVNLGGMNFTWFAIGEKSFDGKSVIITTLDRLHNERDASSFPEWEYLGRIIEDRDRIVQTLILYSRGGLERDISLNVINKKHVFDYGKFDC